MQHPGLSGTTEALRSSASTFLGIPVELRLSIYQYYLAEHRRVQKNIQPSNLHILFLRTCKQINLEAGNTFRRYVSFKNERQINNFINVFILYTTEPLIERIEWVDVANDGRVISADPSRARRKETPTQQPDEHPIPLSNLHLALRRMTSLTHLRVFQCRQGLPPSTKRPSLKFEQAMYPSRSVAPLSSYELFLDPNTKVQPFDAVPADALQKLRLSGECHMSTTPITTPLLRSITLHGVTGNSLDLRTLQECFPGCRLESFSYAFSHRIGFELRNRHLESLVSDQHARLRKLVLLGCSRLTSTAVATCLHNLPLLEHLALGFITVDELRTNFVLALPPTLAVLKLRITNAWYAVPLLVEERGICDAIEDNILRREVPPSRVCVHFRPGLMAEDGRQARWEAIAHRRATKLRLSIGPWEDEYMANM